MPYTMEDFERDYVRDHLGVLTAEELLQHVLLEELLQHVPVEELLQHVPVEELLQHVPAEKLKAYVSQLEKQTGKRRLRAEEQHDRLHRKNSDQLSQRLL